MMAKYRMLFGLLVIMVSANAQNQTANQQWIRPDDGKSPAVWGIRNGIIVGLWPAAIENVRRQSDGGPRGLLRIGYEYKGIIYHINYIAIEPVVNRKMEFSEISPSGVDGKWGKFLWAGDTASPGNFFPAAITRGVITQPVPGHPEIEQLRVYFFMEKFLNGAHPYLSISIRSDRPEELCIEIFNHANSAPMERCALTATMGNYARLRKLYLRDTVIDARKLYAGFDGIDFIEKGTYPFKQMRRNKAGDMIVMAATNESFAELAAWPQEPAYFSKWSWRYRPFYKLTQYWRKEHMLFDSSLQVRVNGRAAYWSGGSNNKQDYISIPGGPAFENFELREKYYPGQKMYFGLTLKTPEQLMNWF